MCTLCEEYAVRVVRGNDLTELHYITAISNVPSMLEHGILSNTRAAKIKHVSIAMLEIQKRRAKKTVPNGRPLHEYANVYINARNKMLYKKLEQREDMCVLRIDTDVLDLPGVVITDRNAASDYVRFEPAPEGLSIVDRERVFAEYWTHPNDVIDTMKHGSQMCAEVLVPDLVAPGHIVGAHVCSPTSAERLRTVAPDLDIVINRPLFFMGGIAYG